MEGLRLKNDHSAWLVALKPAGLHHDAAVTVLQDWGSLIAGRDWHPIWRRHSPVRACTVHIDGVPMASRMRSVSTGEELTTS